MDDTIRRLIAADAAGMDPSDAVKQIWPSPAQAWADLQRAFEDESLHIDDEITLDLLRAAIFTLGRPLITNLVNWFLTPNGPCK